MKLKNRDGGPILRTSNRQEIRAIEKLVADGYVVYKRGWPDLLAVRGDEIRLIEVKQAEFAGLSKYQRMVARAFDKVGIKVEVWSPLMDDVRPWDWDELA